MPTVTCILLLIFGVFLGFGSVAEELCEESWSYHAPSGSCLKFMEIPRPYRYSNVLCGDEKGGPSKNIPGHLVVIQDAEMDMFVRELISDFEEVYIGLAKVNETFVWIDRNQIVPSYRAWQKNQPQQGYDYTVITKDGWKSTKGLVLPYMCQIYASFPAPVLICPPFEEGKIPSSSIDCMVSEQNIYGSFIASILNGYYASPSIICSSELVCDSKLNSISASIFKDFSKRTLKTSMHFSQPSTRSEGKLWWTCQYRFKKIPELFLTADCTTHTFVPPQSLNCSYQYTTSPGVYVVCDIHGVYPKAMTTLVYSIDGDTISELHIEAKHTSYKQEGLMMYNAQIKHEMTDGAIIKSGQHKIDVTVYPDVPFTNQETRFRASLKDILTYTISSPDNSPVFSIGDGPSVTQNQLTVTEGENITLTCKVSGGSPPVRSTVITCGQTAGESLGKIVFSYEGQQAAGELTVTHAMNQNNCICRAKHVFNLYHKQSSIILNVLNAAKIETFTVNQRGYEELEVSENDSLTFRCDAYGTPTPQLRLYQLHSNHKRTATGSRTLEETVGTSLISTIVNSTCENSGTYVCAARNSLSTKTSERRMVIKVRCHPQPYSMRYSDREFGVRPGNETVIKLEIFAFPKPEQDIRVRSSEENSDFDANLYSAEFIYTNEAETKGYIQINMSSTITENGNYTVRLNQQDVWHDIDFSLVPFRKPSCPESLTTSEVSSSFVIFSWVPAPDRGLSQTFTVSQIDTDGVIIVSEDSEDVGESPILHNATELKPQSLYRFRLSVRNAEGTTECPHLLANVTTHASPASAPDSSGSRDAQVIVPIVVVSVVIAVAALLVVVYVCSRRPITPPLDDVTVENVQSSKV